MITIKMGNVISKLDGVTESIAHHLTKALQYTIRAFNEPESTYSVYNPQNNMVYTGAVPRAIQVLQKLHILYVIEDLRLKPVSLNSFKIQDDYELRDYQAEIVENATTREIIQAATGAGKTFVMASLVAKYNVSPVLIIAPKISLASQIRDEFEKFLGIKICLLGGGHNIRFGDIIVSTPQSCPADLIENCKMLMFDEAHNIPAHTIFTIASKAKQAYYRFGVSATPWRDDGKDLLIEAALNIRKPHLSITASKLIQKGKLTPCTINMIPIKSCTQWQGNYNATYDYAIVNNAERNNKIVELANNAWSNNKSTLLLIKKLSHGDFLLSELKKNSAYDEMLYYDKQYDKWHTIGSVEFLNGNDDLSKRNAVFECIKNGFVKILIGSTIADEGLDIPILDTLILAGAGKSSTRAFQRIGRVLRLYKGKTEAIVYDFVDTNKTFFRQAMLRKALYETESLWKINYK